MSRLTLIVLVMSLLIGCNSGSDSSLTITNNADYMAIKYGDESWRRVSDNSKISIQFKNSNNTASILYVCVNRHDLHSNNEPPRVYILNIEKNYTSVVSENSKAFDCDNQDDIPQLNNSNVLEKVELVAPYGYTIVDKMPRSDAIIESELSSDGVPLGRSLIYFLDIDDGILAKLNSAKSNLTFHRLNTSKKSTDVELLLKNDDNKFYVFKRNIPLINSYTLDLFDSDLQPLNAFEPFYPYTQVDAKNSISLNPNLSSGYGSSYNYSDGFIFHGPTSRVDNDSDSALNLCLFYCWDPTHKSSNPRYAYSWRYGSTPISIVGGAPKVDINDRFSIYSFSGTALLYTDSFFNHRLLTAPILHDDTFKLFVKSDQIDDEFTFHSYAYDNEIIPMAAIRMTAIASLKNSESSYRYGHSLTITNYSSTHGLKETLNIPSVSDLPHFTDSTGIDTLEIDMYISFNFIQAQPSSSKDYKFLTYPEEMYTLITNQFF